MLATRCACGFEALADEQIIDHLLAVFEPADAVGYDGKAHEEMAGRVCSCGTSFLSGNAMDVHFFVAFAPADLVGGDGRAHEPVAG